jgi:hypothetical protein
MEPSEPGPHRNMVLALGLHPNVVLLRNTGAKYCGKFRKSQMSTFYFKMLDFGSTLHNTLMLNLQISF